MCSRAHSPTPRWRRRRVRAQFIKGDVTSVELLTEILNSEEIDTVMHFAAQVSSLRCTCSGSHGAVGFRLPSLPRRPAPL